MWNASYLLSARERERSSRLLDEGRCIPDRAWNNSLYMMTVPEFLNRSKNDTNRVIVDIR